MDEATGRCLEATHKTIIVTGKCNESDPGQDWLLGRNPQTPSFVSLFNRASNDDGLLDSNKAGLVYLNTPNGGRYQDWHPTGSLAQ